MDSVQRAAMCSCAEGGDIQPLAGRVARCAACGLWVPSPRRRADGERLTLPRELSSVAPGGLLRGKYRLIDRLGEGAHGVSYLAEHEYLGHPCAVKILTHGGARASEAAIARLRNEARAGYRVNDPNVVRVLDCDVVRGLWYFVMEYVDGADLSAFLSHDVRMPWQQAVRVGLDTGRGLAAIHQVDLLHRDIKPGNLILGTDGGVRVADLGVARLARDRREAGREAGPEMMGTLTYAAPEMFLSDAAVGPQADLYSLGATLYHLVTGRPPHDAPQVFRRLLDLQTRRVTWPADAPDDVPEWLVAAILKLLEIEVADRFDSAATLVECLRSPTEPRRIVAAAPPEPLQPRGVGVLAFRNERSAPDDDWLGYAIANSLWRALSEIPGIYVAGQDALETMLERLEVQDAHDEPQRLLEAGRMVGAGTVITGCFDRAGDRLRVGLEMVRVGRIGSQTVLRVEGALAELAELEKTLLERVLHTLALQPTPTTRTPSAGGAQTLAAQERFVLGKQAFLRGDYDEAITLAEQALQEDPQLAEAIGFIGVCQARLGRYAAAEAQHRSQAVLASEWGDVRLEVEALANLGVMNYFRGTYAEAEQGLRRAAELAEQSGLATEHAQICNNLGFVLFRRGELAEAEQAFLKAIETHRKYGGLTSLVGPYNGSGNVLVEQKRYDEAGSYYRRALALAEEVGDRTSVGMTHTHLGRCATLQKSFAEAQHEFTMALNALEETRFWHGLARAYEHMADMNMRLANYDEAVRCAEQRVELARQQANARVQAAAWRQKADALQWAGRSEEAAECQTRSREIEAGASNGS